MLMGEYINLKLNYLDCKVCDCVCMEIYHQKLWLKVADRSDESVVAWLQTVASSICLHPVQPQQEEEAGPSGCKSAVSWTLVVPPRENMACKIQGMTDEGCMRKTAAHGDDIQQWELTWICQLRKERTAVSMDRSTDYSTILIMSPCTPRTSLDQWGRVADPRPLMVGHLCAGVYIFAHFVAEVDLYMIKISWDL